MDQGQNYDSHGKQGKGIRLGQEQKRIGKRQSDIEKAKGASRVQPCCLWAKGLSYQVSGRFPGNTQMLEIWIILSHSAKK